MSSFLFYCLPQNIDDPVTYAASNQFRRLAPKDDLWIISSLGGKVYLRGHLLVADVVTRGRAEDLLGRSDLWKATYYAVPPKGGEEPLKSIDITDLVGGLAFSGGAQALPSPWTPQSFQTMRELTPSAAAIMADAWRHRASEAPSHRNPPWHRDELILALDLYFRLGRTLPDDTHPEVVTLSRFLNSLEIHAKRPDEARFRNPNGVALKLANFRALDQPGHGMRRGGKLDKEVWEEFRADPLRLRNLAAAIEGGVQSSEVSMTVTLTALEDEDAEWAEGRLLRRLHQVRERSPKLRKAKKSHAMQQLGKLACEVCRFDFAATYGELGADYIECHHTIPVSELTPGSKARLEDVALVCSNCHRMLHRRRPWLRLGELSELLVR